MKTEICAKCGREFDLMKEVSAEMDATMKDGSHRKFALCQDCLMDWLDNYSQQCSEEQMLPKEGR